MPAVWWFSGVHVIGHTSIGPCEAGLPVGLGLDGSYKFIVSLKDSGASPLQSWLWDSEPQRAIQGVWLAAE